MPDLRRGPKSERARKFPTEDDAIRTLVEAYRRLIDLGWRSPDRINDDEVVVLEPPSTGQHPCRVLRDSGHVNYMSRDKVDGDVYDCMPLLVRELREGEST